MPFQLTKLFLISCQNNSRNILRLSFTVLVLNLGPERLLIHFHIIRSDL